MEAYPEDFVNHNFPLVVLSGLEDDSVSPSKESDQSRTFLHEGGFRVTGTLPPLTGNAPAQLLQSFQAADSSNALWFGRPLTGSNTSPRYQIKRTGRVGQTPFENSNTAIRDIGQSSLEVDLCPSASKSSPTSPFSPTQSLSQC